MTASEHATRNEASRRRLALVAARLSDADLEASLGGGWTVSVALAHGAFWDRFVEARWREAGASGRSLPVSVDDALPDLLNQAALAGWRALPGRAAVRLAIDSAEACDATIAALQLGQVEAALAGGRLRMLDRSIHRTEHLDAIEAALGP